MKVRFDPITGKTAEIIQALMDSEDMTQDPELQFKIQLCIEEAVVNVVQYAYEGGNGYIEVGTELKDGVLTITLKDSGVPFNPLDRPDPDITMSAEDRPIGGLGIYLCKQLMDEIDYAFKDGSNILTMKKKVTV